MNRHVPSKEELTNQQLGPVLAVIRELQPFLLEEIAEPGGVPKDPVLDGGVQSAAATTFIKACARVDNILDDAERFSMRTHQDLLAELIKTHKLQQKFIVAQTASTEMLQKPFFMLRPTVALMGENYVAWWGNIEKAGEAICGVGGTPNEALADFDKAFNRAPQDQVVLIAEKAGIDTTQTKTPPTE